tara:strand:+ start:63 stop:200 length:138 start_codon:yes stop_codon:yes gene_type:complete
MVKEPHSIIPINFCTGPNIAMDSRQVTPAPADGASSVLERMVTKK